MGGHWLARMARSGGTGSIPSLVLRIVTVSGPVPESGTVDPGGSPQHSGSFRGGLISHASCSSTLFSGEGC